MYTMPHTSWCPVIMGNRPVKSDVSICHHWHNVFGLCRPHHPAKEERNSLIPPPVAAHTAMAQVHTTSAHPKNVTPNKQQNQTEDETDRQTDTQMHLSERRQAKPCHLNRKRSMSGLTPTSMDDGQPSRQLQPPQPSGQNHHIHRHPLRTC